MNTIIVEFIGYIAAIVGTSLMLPQVIKAYKTKKVDDLSLATVIIYIINCILWSIYGILIYAIPVIVCNIIAFIIGIVQLGLKIKYKTINLA